MPIPLDPHLALLAERLVEPTLFERDDPSVLEFVESVATLDLERMEIFERNKIFDCNNTYNAFAAFYLNSKKGKIDPKINIYLTQRDQWIELFKEGWELMQRKIDEAEAARKHELALAQEQSRHLERVEELKLETERVKLEAIKIQSEMSNQHQITLKEVESRLRIAESQNPAEVQKLLIQAMGRYGEMREKALDEAIRNPSLAEKFQTRAAAYVEMQKQTAMLQKSLTDQTLTPQQREAFIDQYVKKMSQDAEQQIRDM